MIDRTTRQLVWTRAANRCEYCGIHQDGDPYFRFHVEHVTPRQHQGGDGDDNLALACYHCNLNKGPNLTAIDSVSGQVVLLFNPRLQAWSHHFERRGPLIVGLTATGRATTNLLKMNALPRVGIRISTGFDRLFE